MYTRIVGGTLMALGETSWMFTAAPVLLALAPVYRFVPTVRMTPELPGSMLKVMVAGARPLDVVTSSAADPPEIELGTAKVKRSAPDVIDVQRRLCHAGVARVLRQKDRRRFRHQDRVAVERREGQVRHPERRDEDPRPACHSK